MTLPKGWIIASLGEFTLERVEQGEPGASAVPYIDIGSIDRDLKRVGPTEKVTRANAPTRARQWVNAGDVLVSLTRPNLNAVAIVPPELDGAVASTGFDVLRSKRVLPEWVFNRVRSQGFVSDVCEGVQGVVYPAIRPADVRRHNLPIPPAHEQQRIVEAIDSYFTRLDDVVASLERAQDKLKTYRASVLRAAVEGRLVPTEAALARTGKRAYESAETLLARILKERRCRWEEAELAKLKVNGKPPKDDKWKTRYKEPVAPDTTTLPALPEGWCWASPEQLSSTESYSLGIGPFGSNLKVSDYTTEGTPLVFVRNIRAESFDDDERTRYVSPKKAQELRSHQVAPGDILVTKMGDPPGDCCLYPLSRHVGVITADCIKLRLHRYLPSVALFVHAMRSGVVQSQIHAMTKGVAQKKVSLSRFARLALPLPPAAEQQRVADELERLLSVAGQTTTEIKAGLQRCVSLRQAILKWAFEGKLVDQDPTDEPAEKLLDRIRAERAAVDSAKKTLDRRMRDAT